MNDKKVIMFNDLKKGDIIKSNQLGTLMRGCSYGVCSSGSRIKDYNSN